MSQQPVMNRQQWSLVCVLSIIWGWSFVVYKIMGQTYGPLMIAFIRTSIGASFLLGYLYYKKINLWHYRQYLPSLMLLGIFGAMIPFTLAGLIVKDLGSSLSAILNSMVPIYAVILVRLFYGYHRLSWWRFSGIMIALLGIITLMGIDAVIKAQENNWDFILKELSFMVIGLSFGIHATLSRHRVYDNLPPPVMVAGQNISATFLLLPLIFLFDNPFAYPFPPSWELIINAILYNIASMGYAYMIYFRLIKTAGSVNAAIPTMIIPGLAIIYGYWYFGEVLDSHQLLGMVVILLGLMVLDGRLPKKIINYIK